MEVIEPKRKYSYQKKKIKKYPNSAKKYRDSSILFLGKDINDEQPQEGTNQARKRKNKFNSIDDSNFISKKIRFNNNPHALVSPRKHKKKIPKKDNHITEYLDKLYNDEPHFRKSVIRKKTTTKVNFKGFRKVSFLNPKEKKNSKHNVNILNIDKTFISNKGEDYKNKSKSKIFNNNDMYDDQAYGYDKKYVANLIRDDDMTMKSVVISDKNLFNSRNIKRRQTSKTNKSTKKILNILKYKNSEKRSSHQSNNNSTKRQVSSKSNDKKSKKKENKAQKAKEKEKEKDKEKKNINNIEENDKDKIKIDKNNKKNDKKDNEDENIHSKSKKHKKNQELSPKKEIENADTVIQIDAQNKKKKKKQFCCYPFLVCLKLYNNEENDNVL